MIDKYPLKCDVCGIDNYFIVDDLLNKVCNYADDKESGNVFVCSIGCYVERKKTMENGYSKICAECGKDFVKNKKIYKQLLSPERFCSKKCETKFFQRKYGYCDQCGKKITHDPLKIMYLSEMFCSEKCLKEYEHELSSTFENDPYYLKKVDK